MHLAVLNGDNHHGYKVFLTNNVVPLNPLAIQKVMSVSAVTAIFRFATMQFGSWHKGTERKSMVKLIFSWISALLCSLPSHHLSPCFLSFSFVSFQPFLSSLFLTFFSSLVSLFPPLLSPFSSSFPFNLLPFTSFLSSYPHYPFIDPPLLFPPLLSSVLQVLVPCSGPPQWQSNQQTRPGQTLYRTGLTSIQAAPRWEQVRTLICL